MSIVLLILLLGLLTWKGYHAWKRGHNTYVKERQQYESLWEYLVANGATDAEARRPFVERAARRAVLPLLKQWRFWAVEGVLLVLFCLTARSTSWAKKRQNWSARQDMSARRSASASVRRTWMKFRPTRRTP